MSNAEKEAAAKAAAAKAAAARACQEQAKALAKTTGYIRREPVPEKEHNAAAGHPGAITESEDGRYILKHVKTEDDVAEIQFYIFLQNSRLTLKNYMPDFIGYCPTNHRIVLSNLGYGIPENESLRMDLKVGRQLWDHGAKQKKFEDSEHRSASTTTAYGVRLCGFANVSVDLNRIDGMEINIEGLKAAVFRFFVEATGSPEAAERARKKCIKKLEKLPDAILESRHHHISGSLIFIVRRGTNEARVGLIDAAHAKLPGQPKVEGGKWTKEELSQGNQNVFNGVQAAIKLLEGGHLDKLDAGVDNRHEHLAGKKTAK